MNPSEQRKRNRSLGLILVLLFVGLFAVVTATIVTGSKTPPLVEAIVSGIGRPILVIIGPLLIIAAVVEIISQGLKTGEGVIRNLVAPLLGTIGLLLIIGAIIRTIFEIHFQTSDNGVDVVSIFVPSIILGGIGLLLIIAAVIGNRYSDPSKGLK